MCPTRHLLPLLSAGIILLPACQSGRELHYFKSGDNYYRLKINEKSFASKSRYLSGYYDDKAVDKYFSEMSQPKETDSPRAQDVTFINPGASDAGALKLDSNKKFVMILSTNSDAVSEQIGAFAENEQILESIARLSNKDKIAESNQYAQDISSGLKRNVSTIALGDQFIGAMDGTETVEKVKSNLSSFLQNLKTLNNNKTNITGVEILLRQFQK